MKKLIPGWIHQPGWHCASTVISDVMTFKGQPMSEALCFGLGSGLGFAYLEAEEFNPTRMTAVRSRNLEENFFAAMGIPSVWQTSPSPAEALQQSKDYIDQGIPVLIRADIFHLDYYKSKSHFPGHVICMWGYDDAAKEVYVADTEWPGIQAAPYESIQKARYSQMPGYQVRGDHIPVKFQLPCPDWQASIQKALLRQANDLKSPEFGDLVPMGFPGMVRAKERIPSWPSARDWAWSARWFYQVIEKRGTGGGAFRRLYAIFLEEIAKMEPRFKTEAPAEDMFAIAEKWTELSQILKQISEKQEPDGFENAAQKIGDILNKEREFFSRVQKKLAGERPC